MLKSPLKFIVISIIKSYISQIISHFLKSFHIFPLCNDIFFNFFIIEIVVEFFG